MMPQSRYIIGIDEVGRGPLAGPVTVGVVMAERRSLTYFRDIRDSKALTPRKRSEWFARMRGRVTCAVSFVSNNVVDTIGIVPAIRVAIARSLAKLGCDPNECEVLLDGGLKAPERFVCQKTIIRGDESETIIAMASVAAKVMRDRRMVRLAKKYPLYGFEIHKGYGTRKHYEAITRHGLCAIHRRTFCRGLQEK